MAILLVFLGNHANAQSERLLLQVGIGLAEADGLLAIPFVTTAGGIISRPGGADTTDFASRLSVGYRVYRDLYLELGFVDLGEFDSDQEVSDLRPTAKINEWSLGVRYLHPLTARMSAMWRLGITRANIDSERLVIESGGGSLPPRTFATEPIPDETGITWGTGLVWSISDRVDVGFAYNSHELDRTDIASLSATLILHLHR